MSMWYENGNANLAILLSEDSGAPELRNPLTSGIRARGWLSRLLKKKNG